MYLDNEDTEKIKQYLIDNKGHFQTLKDFKDLKKMRSNLRKKFDGSFYEEIDVEFLKSCRLLMAETISKDTGLAVDGILYVIEIMGLDYLKKYLGVRK